MPVPADLVYETSTTTGTGNFTVAAVNGYQRFSTAFGTGVTTNVFVYYISDTASSAWEMGTGHMSDANTLVRDTVILSTNANALVSFGAGTKNCTNDVPAANQITGAFPKLGGDLDTNEFNIDIYNSTTNPVLSLTRDDTGVADDIVGRISFMGLDDADAPFEYGSIQVDISDPSAGLQFGRLTIGGSAYGAEGYPSIVIEEDNIAAITNGFEVRATVTDPNNSTYRNDIHGPDINVGTHAFFGQSDAGNKVQYARVKAYAADDADGAEEGYLVFNATGGGDSELNQYEFRSNGFVGFVQFAELQYAGGVPYFNAARTDAHGDSVSVGEYRLSGQSDAANTVIYANLLGFCLSDADGAETGYGKLAAVSAGTESTEFLRFGSFGGASGIRLPTILAKPVLGTNANGDLIAPAVVTLADGAASVIDASLGSTFAQVATADRTLGTPINPTDGQKIVIRFNASGAIRTLTLPTGSAGQFRYTTDITVLTATASGLTDYIGAIYNLAADRWDVAGYNKGA